MNLGLLKYFYVFLLKSRGRQKLLLMALTGLILSSFALMVIQSTMGGLQRKIIERGKNYDGVLRIELKSSMSQEGIDLLIEDLSKWGHKGAMELSAELLLKSGEQIHPLYLRGLHPQHKLWENEFQDLETTGVLLGADLARKVTVYPGDKVEFISAQSVDSFMGDMPVSRGAEVSDLVITEIPQKDAFEGWVSLAFMQNLLRERRINQVLVFGDKEVKTLRKQLNAAYGDQIDLLTWEDQNSTLLLAFQLESRVMLFLFTVMCLLVSLAITSGFLLYFNRMKVDLISLWILGAKFEELKKLMMTFVSSVSFLSCLLGVTLAFFGLLLFDALELQLMPDIFLDRKIPIHITLSGLLISFLIPFGISLSFGYLAFKVEGHLKRVSLRLVRSFSR